VFGDVEIRWRDCDFKFVAAGMEVDIQLDGNWVEVGGCGLLKPEMLLQAGYDADSVGGFAFGLGLERLAMLKLGIEDIRLLWKSPYVRI
jgi:phenylalanyl-tRNA synthetase alpha chain